MSAAQTLPNWIAVAIGAQHITLWTMAGATVLRQHHLPFSEGEWRTPLLSFLNESTSTSDIPVLVSGSDLAQPVEIPAKPGDLRTVEQSPDGRRLQFLPGLKQAAPLAVMQTAAAQIAGFLALNPKWDGVICLPGAMTHWALVSAAEVVSFQSFLTPRLFQSLRQNQTATWAQPPLQEAAADIMSKPERLAARLAELSVAVQFSEKDAPEANGALWGYLLGAELASARPYWLGQNLALIGSDDLAAPYMAALQAQGLSATHADPERMALAGLLQAWRLLQGEIDTP